MIIIALLVLLLFTALYYSYIFTTDILQVTNSDPFQRYKALSAILCSYLTFFFLMALVWYGKEEHTSFHWFDDGAEWLGLDKLGHFYSAFHISWFFIAAFWDKKSYKQLALCSYSGFLLLSPVELLDGFVPNYGASPFDLLANFIGSLCIFLQYRYAGKVLFLPRFSFYPSSFSILRPGLLGEGFIESFFKDYNGQTYWVTINLRTLTGISRFPGWLNIAFGMGAHGLLGGHDNVWQDKNGNIQDYSHIPRTPQFYIAPDIDWKWLKPRNRILAFGLRVLNMLKFPLPALQLQPGGEITWFGLYF